MSGETMEKWLADANNLIAELEESLTETRITAISQLMLKDKRIAELEEKIKEHAAETTEMIRIKQKFEAENESMQVELSDARSKYNKAIRRQLDLRKDAEQWRYACDNWHQLVKKYMRSGFEAPTLEALVEFWSQRDITKRGE